MEVRSPNKNSVCIHVAVLSWGV